MNPEAPDLQNRSTKVSSVRVSRRTGSTGQAAVSLPQQVAVLAPLVVGREARGVGGLGDLALADLLQGVGTLAIGTDAAHQMHLELFVE